LRRSYRYRGWHESVDSFRSEIQAISYSADRQYRDWQGKKLTATVSRRQTNQLQFSNELVSKPLKLSLERCRGRIIRSGSCYFLSCHERSCLKAW
jgi:hypothetical protein